MDKRGKRFSMCQVAVRIIDALLCRMSEIVSLAGFLGVNRIIIIHSDRTVSRHLCIADRTYLRSARSSPGDLARLSVQEIHTIDANVEVETWQNINNERGTVLKIFEPNKWWNFSNSERHRFQNIVLFHFGAFTKLFKY